MSAKIVFFGVVFSFSSFFPLQTTQAPQTKPHPQNHQKQQKNKQNPFPNNKTMQEAARSRQDERKKNFKKGLDSSESRRRRSEQNVAVRKNRREELALKRRNITLSSPDRSSSSSSSSSSFPSFEGGELTDELTQMVFSNNEEAILHGTRTLRKMLSQESQPPLDEVISCNIIPRLVSLLDCPSSDIQFEAAWALTNVASGNSEHTKAVLQNNAVPAFVKMSATAETIQNKEQATWALGNIAGDSTQCRDYVLECGALAPLVETLSQTDNKSFLCNGTWTLSNLVRGKPAPKFEFISPALGPLRRLLQMNDEAILGDACWAISYMSDGEDERIQAVVDAGLVPRLVDLMSSTNQAIATPSLRAVGNIVTGSAEQTQAALDTGALGVIGTIMERSEERTVLKECCWALSNVTAGTAGQIQQVLECGLAPLLLNLMEDGEFEVRKEVTWTVTNAISGGTDAQINFLMTSGFLEALTELLGVFDQKVVLLCLEALQKVLKLGEKMMHKGNTDLNPYATRLEENGGLEVLEELTNHVNRKVYTLAASLLDTYFEEEEENMFGEVKGGEGEGEGEEGGEGGSSQFAFGGQKVDGGFNF